MVLSCGGISEPPKKVLKFISECHLRDYDLIGLGYSLALESFTGSPGVSRG